MGKIGRFALSVLEMKYMKADVDIIKTLPELSLESICVAVEINGGDRVICSSDETSDLLDNGENQKQEKSQTADNNCLVTAHSSRNS